MIPCIHMYISPNISASNITSHRLKRLYSTLLSTPITTLCLINLGFDIYIHTTYHLSAPHNYLQNIILLLILWCNKTFVPKRSSAPTLPHFHFFERWVACYFEKWRTFFTFACELTNIGMECSVQHNLTFEQLSSFKTKYSILPTKDLLTKKFNSNSLEHVVEVHLRFFNLIFLAQFKNSIEERT